MEQKMKNKKIINIIAILVILISVFCCIVPFVTKSELADKTVISSFGETITLYGKGLYARNSFSCAIQGMDLGIIVPACFVIAHLLKNKHKLGYILGPVIIVKAVTLVTAVFAMAVYMKASGIEVAAAEFIVFGIICVLSVFYFVRIMRQITRC